MENVIKEIKFKLGKKEITLTAEQAKILKDALDEMFGKEIIKEIVKEHHHYHTTTPYYPYYWSGSVKAIPCSDGGWTYDSDTSCATFALTG